MAALRTAYQMPVMTLPLSFEAFYRDQRAPLYRALALTLGDVELAREAVDEAMVRAYQRWGRLCTYDNPAGWVYRVGLNWAVSWTRRRQRVMPVATVPDQPTDGPSPGDPGVARALAGLGEQHRAVLVLRFHLDWSVEQIAAALGVPAGTVKSRLHRGLAAMRAQLEHDDES